MFLLRIATIRSESKQELFEQIALELSHYFARYVEIISRQPTYDEFRFDLEHHILPQMK